MLTFNNTACPELEVLSKGIVQLFGKNRTVNLSHGVDVLMVNVVSMSTMHRDRLYADKRRELFASHDKRTAYAKDIKLFKRFMEAARGAMRPSNDDNI